MDESAQSTVRELFPVVDYIEDQELQKKVVAAWTTAWEEGPYDNLTEVPGLPMLEGTNNVEHTNLVTEITKSMVDTFNSNRDVKLNSDHCIAGAICHDLGKPFEYTDVENGEWINGTWENDDPSIRHPVYSVHIALENDFPIEVVHIIGSHSKEGNYVKKSAEANVVSFADSIYWRTRFPERY